MREHLYPMFNAVYMKLYVHVSPELVTSARIRTSCFSYLVDPGPIFDDLIVMVMVFVMALVMLMVFCDGLSDADGLL